MRHFLTLSVSGQYFIQLAQKDMGRHLQQLPDKDLAYFEQGAEPG